MFESLETEYDFCFIDTPPSLGMLTQAAIYASDSVVIPCTLGKHAVFGVPDMMECIHHLKPEDDSKC